jgi:hypothetical protein
MQRIIRGNIDADEVIPTNLIEFMQRHFGSAPDALTPFNESRSETALSGFWRQGYWEKIMCDSFKYHISAFFTFHLPRSREGATGDIPKTHHKQIPSNDRILRFSLSQHLCNNPLTMRPKLFIAQARIKEWRGPDAEAKNISTTPDDYQKLFFP